MRPGRMIEVRTCYGIKRMTNSVEFHLHKTNDGKVNYRIDGRACGTSFEIDSSEDRGSLWKKFEELQEKLLEQELNATI